LAGLAGISTVIGRLVGGYLLGRVNGNIVGAVALLMAVLQARYYCFGPDPVRSPPRQFFFSSCPLVPNLIVSPI
jgi:predicted MFS family arabinose efflux permease